MTDTVPIANLSSLRSAGRDVLFPFRLTLEFQGRRSELVCTALLRVLPAKRLVCSGTWNNQEVVAKIFLDSRRAVLHRRREEEGILSMEQAGIMTPRLLFKGESSPDGIPVLCFQRLHPAMNFSKAWERAHSDEQREELLARAVALIARQHGAGLCQNDPHLNNFMIAGDEIYAVDGDAVETGRFRSPLSRKKGLSNLALFFAQLYPRFDPMVSAALQAYMKIRDWPFEQGLQRRLRQEVARQRQKRKRNYIKKTGRECSAFVVQKSRTSLMICDRAFYGEEMIRFLKAPDSLISKGTLLKDGNTATVALVQVGGRPLVVKRYNIKGLGHFLKRGLRTSRAHISWRNAHLLRILGIPTPGPVAILEQRRGPFRLKSYFVMEYVEGENARSLFRMKTPDTDRNKLITRVVGLIQMLSNASISHGDFKATNFIFADNTLYITDLDSMREHRSKKKFRRRFEKDIERFMMNWKDLPELESLFQRELSNLELPWRDIDSRERR